MLGQFGLDDEEALLDALARRRMADSKGIPDGTVGPAPEPMEFPEMDLTADDPMAKLPALTPMPARVDLSAARAKDAQQGMARGFETAARQAIGGLTLTKPADTLTPEGNAEQTALADETRARGEVLETRRGQMMERQKALEALLRPPAKAPTMKPPPSPEFEAAKVRNLDAQTTKLLRPPVPRLPKAPKPGAAGSPDGKTLPATTVEGMADLPVAEANIDEMVEQFKRLNMGGLAGKAGAAVSQLPLVGGTLAPDSTEYGAIAKIGMQSVGKILEGGKLAAGDEVKYAAMLPKGGDSPDVVESKRGHLKAFLRALVDARARGLKESGYNVPPQFFQSGGAAPPQQSSAPSAESAKALAWAAANPNDPRAAAIKARLGVK